jgi:hypothetical protein
MYVYTCICTYIDTHIHFYVDFMFDIIIIFQSIYKNLRVYIQRCIYIYIYQLINLHDIHIVIIHVVYKNIRYNIRNIWSRDICVLSGITVAFAAIFCYSRMVVPACLPACLPACATTHHVKEASVEARWPERCCSPSFPTSWIVISSLSLPSVLLPIALTRAAACAGAWSCESKDRWTRRSFS